MQGLVVHPARMRANLERFGGLFFSEAVLLALVKTGLPRQKAYEMVQRSALAAISEAAQEGLTGAKPGRFRELLGKDPDVSSRLDAEGARRAASISIITCGSRPQILERALGRSA